MKRYDELFNGQQIRNLYYNENKTMKEISKIVNIPIEPLRKRIRKTNIKTRKTTYQSCPICENQVSISMFKRHMQSHWWMIRNKFRCKWCNSQYIVKDGFTKINGEKKQTLLCRHCNRITTLEATGSRKEKRTEGLCGIAKILRKSGYTYRKIVDFIKRNYDTSIDEKTAWNWVNIDTKVILNAR